MFSLSDPSVKEKGQQGRFSPGTLRRREENHPGEAVKSRGQEKENWCGRSEKNSPKVNMTGEKIPLFSVRFAPSLPPLSVTLSHCLPLTEIRASGANHGLTASHFSCPVYFPLCPFGSRTRPQEKEETCRMN